jgi:hypothetical protein
VIQSTGQNPIENESGFPQSCIALLDAIKDSLCLQIAPATRIILVSVHQDRQIEAECARNGADCFLARIGLQRQIQAVVGRLFPDLVLEWARRGVPC